jgi:hypothetical protein
MAYRQLSSNEIQQLENQFCTAEDWSAISVDKGFDPSRLHHVKFWGSCKLGDLGGDITDAEGRTFPAGIYSASLNNVIIGNHVRIAQAGNISNYHIDDQVFIQNVNDLSVTGKTSFGNGTEIEVLNEGGGRELIIYDKLSAQIAYIIVMYRHRPKVVEALNSMIMDYCNSKSEDYGIIGKGSRITHSNVIKNVAIGSFVEINGINWLEEGTIQGDPAETTRIGSGVIARQFIILSGSVVDSGSLLDKSFVGQGVRIGKQFSAENSVFFANSEGFHSEAVSLFAGPYTVTHHKSTLLIAGMFSFFNAGSGTNQSNHMYKLGPVHQGVVERGSKTGSFSYLLWPSRVGPFSVVMGKHGTNFDASDLPFSYITVENEKTVLTPAMNLLTVGTRRDTEKWPKRDRRKGSIKYDLIHFDLYNPFVINRVLNGIEILNDLYEKTPKEQDSVGYKGLRIKRLMLKSCRKYYEMAWHIFLGNTILKKLSIPEKPERLQDLKHRLNQSFSLEKKNWIDIAGMIVPADIIDGLMDDIEQLSFTGIGEVQNKMVEIFQQYDEYVISWLNKISSEKFELDLSDLSKEQLVRIITDWKSDSIRLNNMILSDTKKEFDPNSQIGFGHDWDEEVKQLDFEQVRGQFDQNGFVEGIRKDILRIEETADQWIGWIDKMA